MSQKLKDLLKTVGQVLVGAVTTGHILATKKELRSRLTQCGGCPFLEERNLSCEKCGCRVAYKARLKEAKCPIGKW